MEKEDLRCEGEVRVQRDTGNVSVFLPAANSFCGSDFVVLALCAKVQLFKHRCCVDKFKANLQFVFIAFYKLFTSVCVHVSFLPIMIYLSTE